MRRRGMGGNRSFENTPFLRYRNGGTPSRAHDARSCCTSREPNKRAEHNNSTLSISVPLLHTSYITTARSKPGTLKLALGDSNRTYSLYDLHHDGRPTSRLNSCTNTTAICWHPLAVFPCTHITIQQNTNLLLTPQSYPLIYPLCFLLYFKHPYPPAHADAMPVALISQFASLWCGALLV